MPNVATTIGAWHVAHTVVPSLRYVVTNTVGAPYCGMLISRPDPISNSLTWTGMPYSATDLQDANHLTGNLYTHSPQIQSGNFFNTIPSVQLLNDRILTLSAKNYNAVELASEMQDKLNAGSSLGSYTCVNNSQTGG